MNVLITAGPTCVHLDAVRILTTPFSGNTGIRIAKFLAEEQDAEVTLLLGNGYRQQPCDDRKSLRVRRFSTYDDLRRDFFEELKSGQPDVVIATAAVNDYRPQETVGYKFPSGRSQWRIVMRPTEKLVDSVKILAPNSFLFKFKLETDIDSQRLIEIGRQSMIQSSADGIVMNTFDSNSGAASEHLDILLSSGQLIKVMNRDHLPQELWRICQREIFSRT